MCSPRARLILRKSPSFPLWQHSRCQPGALAGVTHSVMNASGHMPGRKSRQMSQERWKLLYRAFLLQTHPDFFTNLPNERAVNERNLQALSLHLGGLHGTPDATDAVPGGTSSTSNRPRLVFFLKGPIGHEQAGIKDSQNRATSSSLRSVEWGSDGTDDSRQEDVNVKHGDKDLDVWPRKVTLPLLARRDSTKLELQQILEDAGLGPPEIPHLSLHREWEEGPRALDTDAHSSGPCTSHTGDGFSATTYSRSWEQNPRENGRGNSHAKASNGSTRKRDMWASAEQEQHDEFDAELAHVLSTEAGRALVRERRRSARSVRKLVESLRELYGFGAFTFRQVAIDR